MAISPEVRERAVEEVQDPQYHYERSELEAEKILEENRDRLHDILPENLHILKLSLAQKLLARDLKRFEASRPISSLIPSSTFETTRNMEIISSIEEAKGTAQENLDHEFRHICNVDGVDSESKESKEALRRTEEMAEELLEIEKTTHRKPF